MALRTKTIEYAFPTNTTILLSATRYDFAAIDLYIPETSSRTFKSVIMEVTCRDAVTTTTAVSQTARLLGIKLGATAFDDQTKTVTIANTGEHMSFAFRRDVTSYFESNFGSGSSQTCQIGVSFTGASHINITAKLIITYEYEESLATTRIKTVRIPIESPTSILSSTLTEIGTDQVPNLDTFLPEASKVYRDIFFQCHANERSNAATDYSFELALDSEAATVFGNVEQGMNSSTFLTYIWKRTDMTTNSTHQFKARTTLTDRMEHLTTYLVVTYEYDVATTTNFMNSLLLPLGDVSGYLGGTNATDNSRLSRTFFIQEPGTITLAQSGVMLTYNRSTTVPGTNVRAGGQSYRTLTSNAFTTNCGGSVYMHRIDSGAAGGAGLTLARGENTITFDMYRTSNTINQSATNMNGLMFLNYTSDVYNTDEDGAHAHTTLWHIYSEPNSTEYGLSENTFTPTPPSIPESNYWLMGVGYNIYLMYTLTDGGYGMKIQKASGDGWEDLYESIIEGANERAVCMINIRGRDAFKRHPLDENGVDIETSRKYKIATPNQAKWSEVVMALTYHSITYTASGTISGYAGDGSGIVVDFFRSDNDEFVGSATSTVGGGFTFTWYDNTINLYAVARESDSRVGRSADALPT